jgi:hypothetical protein
MVQTFKRPLLVLGLVAIVGGMVSSVATANRGHGKFGQRITIRGGFGPSFGGLGGAGAGAGLGIRFGPGGLGGRGHLAPGGPGGRGGAAVFGADVLTPAASFLGMTVTALAADLKAGKTLATEATDKGKTPAALIDAIVAAQKTVLDTQNAAGWLTDAQEASLLAAFTKSVTSLVNVGPPVPPTKKPGLLETAATHLGMTVAELQTALIGGKTLAQVAADKGKTVEGLVTALTAQAKTSLDAAVAAGTITAAQEQTLLTNLTTRTTDLVNKATIPSKAMTVMKSLLKR